jgi:ribonuclease Y
MQAGVVALAALVALAAVGWGLWLQGRLRLEMHARAERLRAEEADSERRKAEARLAASEELALRRRELDEEYRDRRGELQRVEARLEQRELHVESAREELSAARAQVERDAADVAGREAQLAASRAEQTAVLERLASLSAEEARALLLKRVEDDAHLASLQIVKDIEDEARREGERRARTLLVDAMERCCVDHTAESTVAVVPLPSDEVKGRVIGREGRNIRSFEQLTGVDLIIDDTPEAVVISAFDPLRREVARLALEALVADGRIHPGRIEEVVERARRQVDERITESGEQAMFETGVSGLAPELVTLLGKLGFRTSYSQNVLRHSIEVAQMATTLAAELGADVDTTRRAALLHDIGKAINQENGGPHALLGMEAARQHGESAAVCRAIGAHHKEVDAGSLEDVLVLIADAVSAARPGARRDTLESYIRRLERLEELAESFPGVERAYAIQAGREVRIVVKPEQVDDGATNQLARDIAERIEADLSYPGQIKVTVIREQRAVEYAR